MATDENTTERGDEMGFSKDDPLNTKMGEQELN
jgi:hypothetical protein